MSSFVQNFIWTLSICLNQMTNKNVGPILKDNKTKNPVLPLIDLQTYQLV